MTPYTREQAKNGPHEDGARQLFVVHQPLWEIVVDALYDRGIHLTTMPIAITEDPVPTYMFTPTEEQMQSKRGVTGA